MRTMRRISDRASVSVAGEATDPCHVIAGPLSSEVEIDAKVVLHELQHCEVEVTEDTVRDFIATDARSEQGRA